METCKKNVLKIALCLVFVLSMGFGATVYSAYAEGYTNNSATNEDHTITLHTSGEAAIQAGCTATINNQSTATAAQGTQLTISVTIPQGTPYTYDYYYTEGTSPIRHASEDGPSTDATFTFTMPAANVDYYIFFGKPTTVTLPTDAEHISLMDPDAQSMTMPEGITTTAPFTLEQGWTLDTTQSYLEEANGNRTPIAPLDPSIRKQMIDQLGTTIAYMITFPATDATAHLVAVNTANSITVDPNLANGTITTSLDKAVAGEEVILFCDGTHPDPDDQTQAGGDTYGIDPGSIKITGTLPGGHVKNVEFKQIGKRVYFTMPNFAVDVTCKFTKDNLKTAEVHIDPEYDASGAIGDDSILQLMDQSTTCAPGDDVTLTCMLNDNYRFDWQVDGTFAYGKDKVTGQIISADVIKVNTPPTPGLSISCKMPANGMDLYICPRHKSVGLSSDTIDFGKVALDATTTTASQTLTITNNGTTPMSFATQKFVDDASANAVAGANLAAGESPYFTVSQSSTDQIAAGGTGTLTLSLRDLSALAPGKYTSFIQLKTNVDEKTAPGSGAADGATNSAALMPVTVELYNPDAVRYNINLPGNGGVMTDAQGTAVGTLWAAEEQVDDTTGKRVETEVTTQEAGKWVNVHFDSTNENEYAVNVSSVHVKDATDKDLEIVAGKLNLFSFVMPTSDVTITVELIKPFKIIATPIQADAKGDSPTAHGFITGIETETADPQNPTDGQMLVSEGVQVPFGAFPSDDYLYDSTKLKFYETDDVNKTPIDMQIRYCGSLMTFVMPAKNVTLDASECFVKADDATIASKVHTITFHNLTSDDMTGSTNASELGSVTCSGVYPAKFIEGSKVSAYQFSMGNDPDKDASEYDFTDAEGAIYATYTDADGVKHDIKLDIDTFYEGGISRGFTFDGPAGDVDFYCASNWQGYGISGNGADGKSVDFGTANAGYSVGGDAAGAVQNIKTTIQVKDRAGAQPMAVSYSLLKGNDSPFEIDERDSYSSGATLSVGSISGVMLKVKAGLEPGTYTDVLRYFSPKVNDWDGQGYFQPADTLNRCYFVPIKFVVSEVVDPGYDVDPDSGRVEVKTDAGLTALLADATVDWTKVKELDFDAAVTGGDGLAIDAFAAATNLEKIVFAWSDVPAGAANAFVHPILGKGAAGAVEGPAPYVFNLLKVEKGKIVLGGDNVADVAGGDKVSADAVSSAFVQKDASVKLVADEAQEGYEFDAWTALAGDDSEVAISGGAEDGTFVMPDAVVNAAATYKQAEPGPGPDPDDHGAADEARVKSAPAKLEYKVGDALDLSGLVVTVGYRDDTKIDVALADFAKYKITVVPANGTVLTEADNGKDIVVNIANGDGVADVQVVVGKLKVDAVEPTPPGPGPEPEPPTPDPKPVPPAPDVNPDVNTGGDEVVQPEGVDAESEEMAETGDNVALLWIEGASLAVVVCCGLVLGSRLGLRRRSLR